MSSFDSYPKLPPITNNLEIIHLDNDDDASAPQVTDRCVSLSSCLNDAAVDVTDIVYNLNVSETHDLIGIQLATSRESSLDSPDMKIQSCESVSVSRKARRETSPLVLNEDTTDIMPVGDDLEEEKEEITKLDRRDTENAVDRYKSISEIFKDYEDDDDDDFNLLSSNEEEEQRQRDLEFKQRQCDLNLRKENSEKRKALYVSKMAELTERWNGIESRLENRHTERRQQIYKQLLQIVSDYKH